MPEQTAIRQCCVLYSQITAKSRSGLVHGIGILVPIYENPTPTFGIACTDDDRLSDGDGLV